MTSEDEDRFTFFALTGLDPTFYGKVAYHNPFSHRPSSDDLAAIDEAALGGKTVLDAGCGMGKYTAVTASCHAALVVGLDASDAVERAAEVTRTLRNVMIVQGDLFHPPLSRSFDVAFSVGVLPHTPAPQVAFASVAGCLRSGGSLSVWLYPRGSTLPARMLDAWHDRVTRPVMSRLPHSFLKRLCAFLGRLTVLKDRLSGGGACARAVSKGLSLIAVGEHHDPGVGAFLNFDWYSPAFRSRHTNEELREWYAAGGFDPPTILPEPVSAIGFKR